MIPVVENPVNHHQIARKSAPPTYYHSRVAPLCGLIVLLLCGAPLHRCPAAEPDSVAPVRVVVKTTPGFANRDFHPPRGGWKPGWEDYEGYSIELWDKVFRELNKELAKEDLPPVEEIFAGENATVKGVVERLTGGKADVGLGAISVNEARMKSVDFSVPIYESGFQVMVPADQAPADFASLLVPFRQLLKWENLTWILLLVGSLLVISHLVWAAERRINGRVFPDQYHRGIGETVWWSLSTLMSGGCEEKPVQGRAGRFVALIWMFGALMFATFVQSTVTTSMVTGDSGALHGIESFDLRTARFGAVNEEAAAYWMTNADTPPPVEIPRKQFWPHRDEVITALRSGQIDGWVHDSPVLHHYTAQNPDLKVLGKIYGPHSYAFMFRKDFPYRDHINRILVRLKSQGEFEKLERRWIGNIAKSKTSG